MKDCGLAHEELELSICDEDAHLSQCVVQEIDHLKDEDIQDELIDAFSEDFPLNYDHLSKDELYEMLRTSNLILHNHVKRRSDQDGIFGYVVIEYFL